MEADEDEDDQGCRDKVVTLQGHTEQQSASRAGMAAWRRVCPSHHVPSEVGQPVEQRLHAADELHVFGCVDSLLDEEDHKARRDEGHGKDHADGHQHIHRGCYPGNRRAASFQSQLPGPVSDDPIRRRLNSFHGSHYWLKDIN